MTPARLPSPAAARARELVAALGLAYLEGESGFFAVIGRSRETIVDASGCRLAAQSQIYYLLAAEFPINTLHWLASADTHVLLEGGPVDYFIFHADGRAERLTLGRDLEAGQRPVIAVPGNCWKSLRLHAGATHALMVNVLSPEWTPDRVKIGADQTWLERHTGAAPWATRELLISLNAATTST